MGRILVHLLAWPKTVHFNWHYFGFKGLFIHHVWVGHSVKLKGLGRKGSFRLDPGARVTIGMSDGSFGRGGVILFSQDPDSTITIHGRLAFSKGCTFAVGKGGNAEFGRNVVFNSGCLLVVSSSTSFGDDCHIGWNCTFLDDDGHSINRKPTKGEIRIGNHVWIAAEASILKNVIIGDNVVVGYGSLLSNQNVPSNTLVSGPKGIQRAENITWAI